MSPSKITRALLVLSLLPILFVTLMPGDAGSRAVAAQERICAFCGEHAVSDAILNVLLFLPLGWALGRARGVLVALLVGAGLSAAVESVQLFLAGRFTSASDVLANTLGVGVGAWAATRPRLAVGLASAVGGLALFAPAFLLAPAPTEGVYYGQWVAEFGGMEPYRGRVVDARVGAVSVPSWQSPHSERIRLLLREGAPVFVEVELGPGPPGPAPIFSIADDRQRGVFMLGADGADVFVELRRRAADLRMRAPRWWWRDALEGAAPGETVSMVYSMGPRAPCLTLGETTRCLRATAAVGGWSLLVPGGRGGPLTRTGSLIWAILLGVPLGMLPLPVRGRVLVGLALLAGVAAVSWRIPYWVTPWMGMPPLVMGTALGMELKRRRG